MTDYTALVDQALNELAEGEKAWAATSLARRREILDDVQQLAVQHGAEWVEAAIRIKQLNPESPLVGEEWISGPYPLAAGAAAATGDGASAEPGMKPASLATPARLTAVTDAAASHSMG